MCISSREKSLCIQVFCLCCCQVCLWKSNQHHWQYSCCSSSACMPCTITMSWIMGLPCWKSPREKLRDFPLAGKVPGKNPGISPCWQMCWGWKLTAHTNVHSLASPYPICCASDSHHYYTRFHSILLPYLSCFAFALLSLRSMTWVLEKIYFRYSVLYAHHETVNRGIIVYPNDFGSASLNFCLKCILVWP